MKISDELHLPIIAFLYVNIGYINSAFFIVNLQFEDFVWLFVRSAQ